MHVHYKHRRINDQQHQFQYKITIINTQTKKMTFPQTHSISHNTS